MATNFVIVDSTDPAISFASGQWDLLGTRHEYSQSSTFANFFDASFNFTFPGRSIEVVGTTEAHFTSTTLTFGIDDDAFQDFSTESNSSYTLYHRTLFRSSLMDPMVQHTLHAKVKTPGDGWRFDYLLYEPSSSDGPLVDGQYYFVDDTESQQIQYNPSTEMWKPVSERTAFRNTLTSTTTVGSSFSHTFSGSQVLVYGQLSSNRSTSNIKASFTVDADQPTVLEFLPAAIPGNRNVLLFQSVNLQGSKQHTIKMEYVEGSGPLYLDYLLIRPTAITTSSTAASTFLTISPSISLDSGKELTSGAVAGIAIGGVTVLALMVVLVFLFIRWRMSGGIQENVDIADNGNGRQLPPSHLTPYLVDASGGGSSSSGGPAAYRAAPSKFTLTARTRVQEESRLPDTMPPPSYSAYR